MLVGIMLPRAMGQDTRDFWLVRGDGGVYATQWTLLIHGKVRAKETWKMGQKVIRGE
jgi:hypothetical protein